MSDAAQAQTPTPATPAEPKVESGNAPLTAPVIAEPGSPLAELSNDPTASMLDFLNASEGPVEGSPPIPGQPEVADPTPEPNEPAEPSESLPLYTVKVNGEEMQVPMDELTKGYSRQQDYTRKTMELGEQRTQMEHVSAQVAQERNEYIQFLNGAVQYLQNVVPAEPNWDQLLAQNPQEYVRQRETYRQRDSKMAEMKSKAEAAVQQQQAHESQSYKDYIIAEQGKLSKAIPEWSDPEKGRTGRAELQQYLTSEYGFTEQELGAVGDHRQMLLARKAMLYDQLQANAQNPGGVAQQRGPKPAAPGTAGVRNIGQTSQAKKLRSHAKHGTIKTAAAAFEAFLPD